MARNKLTDKQRKKVVADYVENGNYSLTAQMNGIKTESVRRIVKADKDFVSKSEAKKEENTNDMLEYMQKINQEKKNVLKLSLDKIIDKLNDDLDKVALKDIAIVYGTIIDKEIKFRELKLKELELKKDTAIARINIINTLPDEEE